MIARYRRSARTVEELQLGTLTPLNAAIPEFGPEPGPDGGPEHRKSSAAKTVETSLKQLAPPRRFGRLTFALGKRRRGAPQAEHPP